MLINFRTIVSIYATRPSKITIWSTLMSANLDIFSWNEIFARFPVIDNGRICVLCVGQCENGEL
jgi:hypothetical protein